MYLYNLLCCVVFCFISSHLHSHHSPRAIYFLFNYRLASQARHHHISHLLIYVIYGCSKVKPTTNFFSLFFSGFSLNVFTSVCGLGVYTNLLYVFFLYFLDFHLFKLYWCSRGRGGCVACV